jgi:DNA-binding protein HU-beta
VSWVRFEETEQSDPDLGGIVNRRDLVLAVSTQTGVERRQVDSVLLGFTQVVTAVVSKGEPVSISGFAKFVKVDRPARMGRNPQTQEAVRIKASKKARITPLKGFKDAVVKTSLAPKLERGVWPPAPAAAKKSTAKKSTAKKSTGATKAGARKSTAKKSTAKKSTAKKSTTKRATTRKAPARKAPARKTTARKTTARKTTARKTAKR